MTVDLTTDSSATVAVPVAVMTALLDLLEDAAELREREVVDAYRRGRLDGVLDRDLLAATWATAWEVAQDSLTIALQNPPELGGGLADLVAQRRAAVAKWVAGTGEYPPAGRTA